MKAGLKMFIEQKNWKDSARGSSNLSELSLTLGDVASAQRYGAQSVTFADRSGDALLMKDHRTTQAFALHQAGKTGDAENLFIKAETMQKKILPGYSYLHTLAGFQFCDLLFSLRKYQEVMVRAQTTIKLANQSFHLVSIALDKLTIAKH